MPPSNYSQKLSFFNQPRTLFFVFTPSVCPAAARYVLALLLPKEMLTGLDSVQFFFKKKSVLSDVQKQSSEHICVGCALHGRREEALIIEALVGWYQ